MKIEIETQDELADIVYLLVTTNEAKDLFGKDFNFLNECWSHYLYDDEDKIITYYFHGINEDEYFSRAGIIQENVTYKYGKDWTLQFVLNTDCTIDWEHF